MGYIFCVRLKALPEASAYAFDSHNAATTTWGTLSVIFSHLSRSLSRLQVLRGGRVIMNMCSWTSTINRQVPEVWTKWVNIKSIWIHTWNFSKTVFYMATKNTAMTHRIFPWWNEDKMKTSNGASYWRDPKPASNCTLRQGGQGNNSLILTSDVTQCGRQLRDKTKKTAIYAKYQCQVNRLAGSL